MARSPVRPRKANADSNPDAKTLISPSDEPITDGEIETCLSMERKIVGRVEILEPDNGRTVYFLVSGKNDLKSSTWYEGYTYWASEATAELVINDDGSEITADDIASFVTLVTVIKGADRVFDAKYSHICYLRGWPGIRHHQTFVERIRCATSELARVEQLRFKLPDHPVLLSNAQLDPDGEDPLECYGKAVLFVKDSKTISTQLWFLVEITYGTTGRFFMWTNHQDEEYGDSKITEMYTRYATEAHGVVLVDTGRKDLYMSVLNIKRIVDSSNAHLGTLLKAVP